MAKLCTDQNRHKEELNKDHCFFTILDTVSALIVVLDQQGQIVYFNCSCEKITGYSFDAVKGRHICELFLMPQEEELVKVVCQSLQAGSFPQQYQAYWGTKNGNHQHLAWSNTIVNNHGRVKYIVCTGTQLSECQLLKAVSKQQNKHSQLLAEITLKIRQSLQLEEILQTSVSEVRNLLEADRVLIYRLWPDATGSIVTEAVVPQWRAILKENITDVCFQHYGYIQQYQKG